MKLQLFKYIRNISRNDIVRKAMPYSLQTILWNLVLKSKGEKLRTNIVKYFEDNKNIKNTKTKEAVDFLKNNKNGLYLYDFLKIWLFSGESEKYFDFNGAKLPDVSNDIEKMNSLLQIFQDTFMFSCIFDDCYDKEIVEKFDSFMMEGPYGYRDGSFDVSVKKGDVVIDAGAWIGDFSAYAASKGALVYGFEPINGNFDLLKKTAELNSTVGVMGGGGGGIYPIKKGLGNKESNMKIFINERDSAGSSMYWTKSKNSEEINITTLDKFIEEHHIDKIDFIKSDIEGGEKELLQGAANVLRKLAPKLAICTYHSPKDPELLEEIIMATNPKYKVIHTSQKLFAMEIT